MLFSQIKQKYTKNQQQIAKLRIKINKLPDGTIACNLNGKHIKWYVTQNKKHLYLPKKHRPLAEQLVLKKYYSTQLKELEQEQAILETYLNTIPSQSPSELMWSDSRYRDLLSSTIDPMSNSYQEWANADYTRNPYFPENLIHSTPAGYKVRSKSESLIAIALTKYQIPHRYECRLMLGGGIFYPDFTLLHPETGNLIYWEHFGMMDNADYAAKACDKISQYIRNGLIPTIHLIMTFETADHPFDYEQAVQTIEKYFL